MPLKGEADVVQPPDATVGQGSLVDLRGDNPVADAVEKAVVVLSWIYTLVVGLMFVYLGVQGIKYATSGGDPEKAGDAKKGLVYAMVGIAFVIGIGAFFALIGQFFGITINFTKILPW